MPTASSLTFTTLLAIVPIVTVALTMVSAFPVFREASGHLEAFLLENMIPESAENLAAYARQFTENAGRLTAVGLVFLFVAAMIVLMTIDRALNGIWRVPRPRPAMQRVFIYWALLTIGPVLIGLSLSITSWLVSVSLDVVKEVPYGARVLARVVPIALTGIAFSMLYLALPNRRVLWRDAFTGGFLAAVAFEAMKHGFAVYVTRFPAHQIVYGAFAAIPIFLLWIYLSWLVVLFGAVAAAVLPEWRERISQVEPAPGSRFLDALQVLRLLAQAQTTGEIVSERRLHSTVKVRADIVEAILDTMRAAHWVDRAGGGWVLTRDPGTLRVIDVYDLFVFRVNPSLPARRSGQALDRAALALVEAGRARLDIPLEEMFRRAAAGAASAEERNRAPEAGTTARAPEGAVE